MRGVGAYGLPWREPVGSGNSQPTGSQVLTFTLGCDPARQNYISIKLWGNDAPAQTRGTPPSSANFDHPGRFKGASKSAAPAACPAVP